MELLVLLGFLELFRDRAPTPTKWYDPILGWSFVAFVISIIVFIIGSVGFTIWSILAWLF